MPLCPSLRKKSVRAHVLMVSWGCGVRTSGVTRSRARTGMSGPRLDRHAWSMPRLARHGGNGPGCQTPTVILIRVVAGAAGAASGVAAGVAPYFTKCRGTTRWVAGHLLKSSVPHTGQVSTRRPVLRGPPVPEHSIRRRVMGRPPACRGLVRTLPLSFRLLQIASPFTLRSCASGMPGYRPLGYSHGCGPCWRLET